MEIALPNDSGPRMGTILPATEQKLLRSEEHDKELKVSTWPPYSPALN